MALIKTREQLTGYVTLKKDYTEAYIYISLFLICLQYIVHRLA